MSGRNDWVPLGPYNWLTPALMLSLSSGLAVGLCANWVFQIIREVVDNDSRRIGIGLEIVTYFAALLIAGAVVVLVQHLRYPRPFANFETGTLKVGRQKVQFSDISWARFEVVTSRGRRRRLTLMFGAQAGARVIFNVGPEGRWAMSASTRDLVAQIIDRSEIRLPVSSYDPSGQFARYNFPSNLDKQTALKVVLDPLGTINQLHVA